MGELSARWRPSSYRRAVRFQQTSLPKPHQWAKCWVRR